MRLKGQPPLSRIIRGFLPLRLSPRTRRNDCFTPTAPPKRCRIWQSRLLMRDLSIHIRNRCGGQQPFLLREQEREEAATPGQPAALARSLEVSPATHSRESPAATGSPAIIRQSQELSRFAATHSGADFRRDQYKKRSRLCRTCGRCDSFVEA